MLPMIVSVCLSKGAMAMSRKKVIVKRLNSIQNFGAMDVLCTDKTGTLTIDRVILEIYCDVFKNENEEVLRDAYLISHFQTGLKNVLDRAVLKHAELHGELGIEKYVKMDEIPFDFSRRMMSVVGRGTRWRAPIADQRRAGSGLWQDARISRARAKYLRWSPILRGRSSRTGKQSERRRTARPGRRHEKDRQTAEPTPKLTNAIWFLTGYIAFLDPPKETADRSDRSAAATRRNRKSADRRQ